MASKAIKAVAIATVVAISGYWYWSPFLAVRQLQSAAQKKDADAFNEHVDYPKLRESLKGQFSPMFADKLGKPDDFDNDFTKAGAALGTMIGMAVANPIVDAMVQPETIMHAMQDGQLSPKSALPSDAPERFVGQPDYQAAAEPREDKFTVMATDYNAYCRGNEIRHLGQNGIGVNNTLKKTGQKRRKLTLIRC